MSLETKINRVQSNVTAALAALAEKGVTVPDGANSDDLESLIGQIEQGGGGSGGTLPAAQMKAVNFYDYDGTRLYSYTVEEAAALTELPPLPSHDGLICQGWNWNLDDIKAMGRAVDVGAMYITDDGKTRVYITLQEGRTSPMLGCCPNGTVTVDWGDGTTPNTLTGTSLTTVKWTSTHNYAQPGDYVITLTVNGEMCFYGNTSSNQTSGILRHSSGTNAINQAYKSAVRCIEIGSGVTSIGGHAFRECRNLTYVVIPNGVTDISDYAFYSCYSLAYVVIPNSTTRIGNYMLVDCYNLASVVIPDSVTSIGGYAFRNCRNLTYLIIPNGVTGIGSSAFEGVYALASVVIPDSVTSIPSGVFSSCYGVRFYDFTKHTTVPTLSNTNAFSSISADCEIRVHAALADEWKAATNWSTYADQIVGV